MPRKKPFEAAIHIRAIVVGFTVVNGLIVTATPKGLTVKKLPVQEH